MKELLRILGSILLFFLLTAATQVGGIVYLFYRPLGWWMVRRIRPKMLAVTVQLAGFLVVLSACALFVVPPIAEYFGRVPLPIRATAEEPVRPARWFYVIANRHYVRPELREVAVAAGQKLRSVHADANLVYLDAGFPFFDDFPLLPHLSHDDGRKLDVSFAYRSMKSNTVRYDNPSWLGYGYVEGPSDGEENWSERCREEGAWQYDMLSKITRQDRPYSVDVAVTKDMIRLFLRDPDVNKLFLEPHLSRRWGLNKEPKIKFHGCHAVRHDDHLHIQL
jgi:hypothetical protein